MDDTIREILREILVVIGFITVFKFVLNQTIGRLKTYIESRSK